MNNIAITPEMLLGALVLFAVVLLIGGIVALVWLRAAVRFGTGFQNFSALRDKEEKKIHVNAIFADGSTRPTKRGLWESLFPPPAADVETEIEKEKKK